MVSPKRFLPYVTYGHVLDGMCEASMILVRRISEELKQESDARPMSHEDMLRQFAILSAHVRRAIMVSRYLESRGLLGRAPKIGLLPTLDIVLGVLSEHKVDAETYNYDMDLILEAAEDDFSDIPGCRPVTLIAELLRDIGMVAHAVPAEWLDGIPPEFRLLAARTAAAAIRPSSPAVRVGHVMER